MITTTISSTALASVADAMEGLISVEIRPQERRGVVRALAEYARRQQGAAPVQLAAQLLAERVSPGDIVVVSTGFLVPGVLPVGENDGPPGAAALAKALRVALGATPLLLTEQGCLRPLRACLDALGLRPLSVDGMRFDGGDYLLQPFPADHTAEIRALAILSRYRPKAVIVTEKPGLNAKGVAHRGNGQALGPGRAKIEMLLQAAQRDEVATIAIGDLGNEAGLGLVTPVVRELHRYGAKCLCPCGAGLAVTDRADVTVIGQVSNWAAYAIAALLAVIKDEPAALHRPQLERALLQACIGEGAIDGYRMMPCFSCDDVDGQIHMDIVEILAAIAETALRAPIE